jgi:hypothetical protein
MSGVERRKLVLAALLFVAATRPPAADAGIAAGCTGDCDASGAVTIDEMIRGVRLALGGPADDCLSRFDRDADGRAGVAELLLGVRNSIAECTDSSLRFAFDFGEGASGWMAGFADYPPDEEEFYELEAGIRPLPEELGADATGFLLSGNNHSDDLFMFLARRLGLEDGVAAGQAYEVAFDIRFASNAPSGCPGIGGAPGESVFLKAGASGIEPLSVPGGEGLLVLNVDKGNQGSGGADVSLAGNIANGMPCELDAPYVSLRRSHTHPSPVVASDAGEIWLLIGTDSGFEGTTALYYEAVEVSLSETDRTAAPTAVAP